MTITKRDKLDKILEFVEKNNISAYKIAKATKISEAGIGKILNKLSKNPQERTVDSIYDYLFQEKKSNESELTFYDKNDAVMKDMGDMRVMYVPLVQQFAYAGYLSGYGDPEYINELPKTPWLVDKDYKGDYFCFEVRGDSMFDGTQDSLLENDILLCRNVRREYWRDKLHIKKWNFVVVHKELGIVVKQITKHDTSTGDITLHSLNEMYEDYEVNLDDVTQIFNVVDIKRKM